jgi:hypothetical protein
MPVGCHQVLSVSHIVEELSVRFWVQPDDVPVEFTFMDILRPRSSVPGITSHGQRIQGVRNKGSLVEVVRHPNIPKTGRSQDLLCLKARDEELTLFENLLVIWN